MREGRIKFTLKWYLLLNINQIQCGSVVIHFVFIDCVVPLLSSNDVWLWFYNIAGTQRRARLIIRRVHRITQMK